MSPALATLTGLVVLDGAGAGFRAAAGRSARIDKRAWYARALLRGAAFGAAVSLAAWASAVALAGGDPAFWARASALAAGALRWYAPPGVLVLALLALRAVPSVDARSIASTVVFGPLTLLRTPILVAGAAPALLEGGVAAGLASGLCAASLAAGWVLGALTPRPDG